MTVGELLVATFASARSASQGQAENWVGLSIRIGGMLPRSMLMATVQRLGELDALCRAIEIELEAAPPRPGVMDFRHHYYSMMAEHWLGTAYSICYILGKRKLMTGADFEALSEDLRLIRVQLEKYEIPSDQKLTEPLSMTTVPSDIIGMPASGYVYDKDDAARSHIGRRGISARRALMWEVIDIKSDSSRWLERIDLSDRFANVFTASAANS
jgi:hypothetical protein